MLEHNLINFLLFLVQIIQIEIQDTVFGHTTGHSSHVIIEIYQTRLKINTK